MTRIPYIAYFTLSALAVCPIGFAQDSQSAPQSAPPQDPTVQQQNNNQNRGWRRVEDPAPADATAADPQNDPAAPPPAAPGNRPSYNTGQPAPPPNYDNYQGPPANAQQAPPPNYQQAPPPNYQQAPPPNYQGAPPNYQRGPYGQGPAPNYPRQTSNAPMPPIPASLTIKPGTYVTVRVNQVLSSDHNHPGDAFAATLVKPVVIDGVVVAERGQTIGGRVAEAKKAGLVEGTSRLGVQLTDLTLADGQSVPINSQLVSRQGPTSVGRDAGAVAGTTAIGAAAGAAADWGRGAAIGAGAGAAAGIIGVLLTRGRATMIFPEQVLTFRVEAPVTISTDRAPQAFRYVQPSDYQQADLQRRPPTMRTAAPPVYYGPGYYSPYYAYPYPYYWGPSIGFYYGRGWGWRR